MKRILITILAAGAFGFPACASPSTKYINTGTVTNTPVIDALTFENLGTFEALVALSGSGTQYGTLFVAQPYATQDTLHYLNLYPGTMIGATGFLFQTETTAGSQTAQSFYNTGAILGVDVPTGPEFPSINGTRAWTPGTGTPYPSQVLIRANNIYNGPNGSITVGADGVLQMHGVNVTNHNGALVAGDLTGNDPYDETSIDQMAFTEATAPGATTYFQYFMGPPSFFDLWWGVTNITGAPNLLSLDEVSIATPPVFNTLRAAGLNTIWSFELATDDGNYAAFVNKNVINSSNIYYNIVLVNTNFINFSLIGSNLGTGSAVINSANTNISVQVGFTPFYDPYFDDTLTSIPRPPGPDNNAVEAIVQFSQPCLDVISGQMENNSVYLLDAGAFFSNNVSLYTNTAWLNGYARPAWFEISTETPAYWAFATPANDPADTANYIALIRGTGPYGTYQLTTPGQTPWTGGSYAVQVGWNPEEFDGVFPATRELFESTESVSDPDIPAPINQPARIDIEGKNVDLTGARIRAEGFVTLVAPYLASGATQGVDWGSANATLGARNGNLLISNVLPQSFTRLRGDIFAWAANWYLGQTNAFVTNSLAFHLLVVDQNLQGSFSPTVQNLALTGQERIEVDDPLTVLNKALFETTNLTIRSTVHFTQNVSSFGGSNAPLLKELIITNNGPTNGLLWVDNVLDLGYDPTDNQISPVDRQYSILGIGNFGQILATTPSFQSAIFENDGNITTSNGSSLIIYAQTLAMGQVLTSQANSMLVNGNVILSAANIVVANSTIIAGYPNTLGTALISAGGSLLLQSAPAGQITDLVPGTATTNNVLNNYWEVSSGFSLPVKPATGNLFGTTIKTIATNSTTAQHVWAGRGDYTNVIDGFLNNVVIGHLILSWQSPSALLSFSGAGTSNGLYVDYLDFDSDSLYGVAGSDNYKNGLSISNNLTIYFADCNLPIDKVTAAYGGRLVWVSNFWGPNSTTVVTNGANGQTCLVSAGVVASQEELYHDYNNPYPLNLSGTWYYGSNNECPAYTLTAESAAPSTNQPFTALKGTYKGLFLATNQPSSTNSGFFTFTVSKNGAFTGRLLMGPATYSFSGAGSNKFSSNDIATVTARSGNQTLAVTLQLQQVQTANGLSAQVQGEVNGGTWVAPLIGNLKPVWTPRNPAPFKGRYTLVIANDGASNAPAGDGYGCLTVSKLGILSAGGRLADGSAFSQSVPLSEGGQWPFYAYAGGGKDVVLGWISFESSYSSWIAFVNSGMQTVTVGQTNILWSKAPSSRGFYNAGFSSTNFVVTGSPYSFPGKSSSGLNLISPEIVLSGGGLASAQAIPVKYNGRLKYATNTASVTINPTLGTFSGTAKDVEPGHAVGLAGVVLQNQAGGGGFGFFLGTNDESGAVLLQGQ